MSEEIKQEEVKVEVEKEEVIIRDYSRIIE